MKNKVIIIVVLLLIFLNLLLLVFIVVKQKSLSPEGIIDNNIDYFYQARRQILEIEHKNEGLTFPFMIDQGCDTIHPVKLIIKKPTLVCYFSIQACTPCYQHMLEQVKHVFPDYAQRNDIIFLSNDLDFKLRDSYFNKQIYANINFKSGLPIDSYHSPVLFLLNEDMKLDMVFVADKQTPDYTEDYLQIVKERFYPSNDKRK